MNWDAIGAIAELLGAIGVILTLFYLAAQIRQNTTSIRTVAGMDMSKQAAAWFARMTVQPELGRIYSLAAEDPDSLTPEESFRFLTYIAEIFFLYEGQYEMYRQDQIAEEIWIPKRDVLLGYLKNPIVESWWVSRLPTFTKPFSDYMEGLRLGSGDISFTYEPLIKTLKKENSTKNPPGDSKGEQS